MTISVAPRGALTSILSPRRGSGLAARLLRQAPCRRPWGLGAATGATPIRNRSASQKTTTRRGVSRGRPWRRGAASSNHTPQNHNRLADEVPSSPTPIGDPPLPRLAGPRSGTHGGARDGRGNHHTHLSSPTPFLVSPDSDRGPTPPHSSCRTPIRYPRWGTARARQHHQRSQTTTRTGVSCGRPSAVRGTGRGAYEPHHSSCRTPIRYPSAGHGTGAPSRLGTYPPSETSKRV